MQSHLKSYRAALACGVLGLGLALAAPVALASGGGSEGASTGDSQSQKQGAGSAHGAAKTDLTTCNPGQVWDTKKHKCLQRRSEVLPDSQLTEYAFALAKADRFQEALDVLDSLKDPNTPRALNYRGYATRKLGRTDEGIGYYLKSVALDPQYPQVREYLGEAYVIEGRSGAGPAGEHRKDLRQGLRVPRRPRQGAPGRARALAT